MRLKKATIFFITMLSLGSYANENPPYKIDADLKKIDAATALELAAKAYDGSDNYKEYYVPVPHYPSDKGFFVFEGLGPQAGAFGYFAVNPWTGDVWSQWSCKKITSPSTEEIQVKIKKQMPANELKQYEELSKITADCIAQ